MSTVRVLVVEDTQVWQDIIRDVFKSHGCKVDIAGDYQEARRKLDENTYDMVTLDMALSADEESLTVAASSGWRLLVHQLTHHFPGTAIYVISATFGGEPKRAFDLNREYGVKGFMTKQDFDPQILTNWVNQVQEFKESGGRPDVTTQELLRIYKSRSGVTAEELLEKYKQQRAILRKNKAEAELQRAKHGLRVPLDLLNTIDELEKEIERCEKEIERLESEIMLTYTP